MKALTGLIIFLLLSGINLSEASACQSPSIDSSNPLQNSTTANPITLDFQSGARWELCWEVDDHSGLSLSQIYYGGPSMPLRKIMDSASIGQIIFQYDEDTTACLLYTSDAADE